MVRKKSGFWKAMATPVLFPWDDKLTRQDKVDQTERIWYEGPEKIVNNNLIVLDRSMINDERILKLLDHEEKRQRKRYRCQEMLE